MPKFNLYYDNANTIKRWREAAKAEKRSLSQFIRIAVDKYINDKDENGYETS